MRLASLQKKKRKCGDIPFQYFCFVLFSLKSKLLTCWDESMMWTKKNGWVVKPLRKLVKTLWKTTATTKNLTNESQKRQASSQRASVFSKTSIGEHFTTARAPLRAEITLPTEDRSDFWNFCLIGRTWGGSVVSARRVRARLWNVHQWILWKNQMLCEYLVVVISWKLTRIISGITELSNGMFFKMCHIHMKLISSVFKLEQWPSNQKASKFSREYKFYIDMSTRALPRTLLPAPFRQKFRKIRSEFGGRRGFRAQECARGCEMFTNGFFWKKYMLFEYLVVVIS